VVGASEREGTVGHGMVAGLLACAFEGPIYAVNPKYDRIQGVPCFPSLRDLPEPVDLALLGVNSIRMEQQVADAIAKGIKACTIFDACYLDDEHDRGLLNRLKAMTREAGMPVCGGNGMGFLNMADRISATTYNAAGKMKRVGNVAFVTHSGTVFSEIGLNDFRYACNLVVSCGQEINGTMADYIDFALSMPSTKVIALFMETARDPEGMAAALAHARRRDIPVVAMKVGRTPAAASFAVTHSDALVGDDAAYAALFDREGVMRVDTMDEMGNLLTLLSHDRQPAAGGMGVCSIPAASARCWSTSPRPQASPSRGSATPPRPGCAAGSTTPWKRSTRSTPGARPTTTRRTSRNTS
jgi:acyl-CoA synthetase (NDP forming)